MITRYYRDPRRNSIVEVRYIGNEYEAVNVQSQRKKQFKTLKEAEQYLIVNGYYTETEKGKIINIVRITKDAV